MESSSNGSQVSSNPVAVAKSPHRASTSTRVSSIGVAEFQGYCQPPPLAGNSDRCALRRPQWSYFLNGIFMAEEIVKCVFHSPAVTSVTATASLDHVM